jgi:hypothetical protein
VTYTAARLDDGRWRAIDVVVEPSGVAMAH